MKNPWLRPTECPCDLMAIDMHTHINCGQRNDTVTSEGYTADLEDLIAINRAAGIEKMFCSTFASVLGTDEVIESNDYLHKLIDEVDCLYQWVVIDPRNEESFRQAERMLPHKKCVGIKLHPVYHKYSMVEYADKLFSFASQFQAAVLIHPNEDPIGAEKDAAYILPIADKYPDVNFIMAHLGNQSFVDALKYSAHKNVYVDTSGIASSKNLILEYTCSQVGADRILFGTDTYSSAFQRGRVEFALLSPEDKRKILRDNALRLFAKNLE